MTFSYKKTVNFYETDAMQVVHHSNYIRFFEEARLAWLKDKKLMKFHSPHIDMSLAVIDCHCRYKAPLYFGDEAEIKLQFKLEGFRLTVRYAIYNEAQKLVTTGHTIHVPVNSEHKICKIPEAMQSILEEETWTATWP